MSGRGLVFFPYNNNGIELGVGVAGGAAARETETGPAHNTLSFAQ